MTEISALADALEAPLGSMGIDDWRDMLGAGGFEVLRDSGVLIDSAPRWKVRCDACFEAHPADVGRFEGGGYRHYCPEAGWVSVKPSRLETLTLDLGALFLLLNGGGERPGEMVAGRVWMLGDVALLRGRVTMVFARAIGETAVAEKLAASLQKTTPAQAGLVLTSSAIGLVDLSLPRGYKLCRLQDALCVEGGRITRDDARLASWLGWRGREREAAKASQGGRPSKAVAILEIHEALRSAGSISPSMSRAAVARAIRDAWPTRRPGEKAAGVTTIKRALASVQN